MKVVIPEGAQATHTVVTGVPGCGKTRLLARALLYRYLCLRIPTAAIDVVGTLSTNLFDKLARLPPQVQAVLWPRVLYVDCAGLDEWVVPDPLLYRVGDESLYEIAQRPIETWLKLSPQLERNPTVGEGVLKRVGTYALMLLAAQEPMGQVDQVVSLLDDPEAWTPKIQAALAAYPLELRDAARYFLETYPQLRKRPSDAKLETDALRLRVAPYTLDPTLQAIQCADRRGLDWDRLFAQEPGPLVLLDLHRLRGEERKRFVAQWTLQNLLEALERRPPGKYRRATVMIDELSYLVSEPTSRNDKLDEAFVGLVRRDARNRSVALVVSFQAFNMLSEPVANAVMDFGVHIHGPASDLPTAIRIAERFLAWDPHWVRKTEYSTHMATRSSPGFVDVRTTEYTRDEQVYLLARKLIDGLPRFRFMVGVAPGEGAAAGTLRRVSIERLDPAQYPEPSLVAAAQQRLMARDGVRVGSAQPAQLVTDIPGQELVVPGGPAPDTKQASGDDVAALSGSRPVRRAKTQRREPVGM